MGRNTEINTRQADWEQAEPGTAVENIYGSKFWLSFLASGI